MAAKQKRRERRKRRGMWGKKPAPPAAMAGLLSARAALYGDGPGLSVEEALAWREQIRQEDEARRTAQGCLKLGPAA